jgi:Protein of unknown function (DUF4238)
MLARPLGGVRYAGRSKTSYAAGCVRAAARRLYLVPLDHYVSQVHLRKFLAPDLGNRMFAMSKTTLKRFPTRPVDVCRIDEGSTNAYLTEPRAVEDFLTLIEPKYNSAIESFLTSDIDAESVMTVAGFIAYVYACSPTGMRLNSVSLRASVEATAEILDRKGGLPQIPEELGASTIKELFDGQAVGVKVDPKFPQAMGISRILGLAARLGNFPWQVLRNNDSTSPFFSSDFPIALQPSSDPRIMNKIVPLTPVLAIRILPSFDLETTEPDFAFSGFRYQTRTLHHNEVRQLNELLVRAAEDFVFYSADNTWVPRFVERNRHFRTESTTDRLPTPTGGELQVTRQRIAPFQRPAVGRDRQPT